MTNFDAETPNGHAEDSKRPTMTRAVAGDGTFVVFVTESGAIWRCERCQRFAPFNNTVPAMTFHEACVAFVAQMESHDCKSHVAYVTDHVQERLRKKVAS